MSFKNPFQAVPIEMGKRYREKRDDERIQAARNNRKATIKLAAIGLFAGIALGGAALLLQSDKFLWVRDLVQEQPKAASTSVQPQTMLTTGRRRLPQVGDYWPTCRYARVAGTAPINRGEPGYRDELDIDGDGVACEPVPGY